MFVTTAPSAEQSGEDDQRCADENRQDRHHAEA
jgi:hypothetical protein